MAKKKIKKKPAFRASNLPADIDGPKTIKEMFKPCVWKDKEIITDKDSVQDILVGMHGGRFLVMQIIGYPLSLTPRQAAKLVTYLQG